MTLVHIVVYSLPALRSLSLPLLSLRCSGNSCYLRFLFHITTIRYKCARHTLLRGASRVAHMRAYSAVVPSVDETISNCTTIFHFVKLHLIASPIN
jgi:hypothetical protein